MKTSVDFTACDAETDRPLLSLEFDGLGHGYSQDGRYVELVESADPYRREKLELKLRISDALGYPLFVIAYDESAPIAGCSQLTLAHVIIGKSLAAMHLGPLVEQKVARSGLDRFPESEHEQVISDILISTEVELDFEWNPLAYNAASAMHTAMELGVEGYSHHYLTDPPLPELQSINETATLLKRAAALKRAKRIGCRVTLHIRDSNEEISGEAWMRNITGHGFTPFGIVEEVAEFVAAQKFLNPL